MLRCQFGVISSMGGNYYRIWLYIREVVISGGHTMSTFLNNNVGMLSISTVVLVNASK